MSAIESRKPYYAEVTSNGKRYVIHAKGYARCVLNHYYPDAIKISRAQFQAARRDGVPLLQDRRFSIL